MLQRLIATATAIVSVIFLGSSTASAQTCELPGAIGGIVFHDANGNGVRNAGEPGINGVQLRVTGPTGSALLVTSGGVADMPGFYSTGPTIYESGTYTVEVISVPAGYVVTTTNPQLVSLQCETISQNGKTITQLQKKQNLDFGLGLAPCTSSIGDRVWDDLNANGIQDAGEPGISGVVVRLFDGATQIATTTTDANGIYNFVVPCTRTFRVEVETPSGYVPSPSLQGPDRNVDSDGSPTDVTVGHNEHRRDVDFGFYALCQGVIGDFVWHDLNRNGVQEPGEPGLYRVKVELLQGGVVVRETLTDENGWYQFTGVCPGTYGVRYAPDTVPAGFLPTLTDQGTPETDSNPSPTAVTLDAFNSVDLTIDFGFQVPCSGLLGDFVWNDVNANGIQDDGEAGIPGVQVLLYREGESMPAQVAVTDASGYYQFTGLCGGSYVVEVNPTTLPDGQTWVSSPANQGSDDAADSDGIDHRASVTLPADNGSDLTIDFGYYVRLPLTAAKTAAGSYDRQFSWSLAKAVSPVSHTGQAGQTAGSSTWTVTATRTETLANFQVVGQITVGNPNGYPVAFTVEDQLNDGTAATVSCPTNTAPANGSVACTYSAAPAGATATLNTATVASAVGGAVATAPVSFAVNTIGDAATTLADPRFGYSQLISDSTAPVFPETFVCPADASLYTNNTYTFSVVNTATLTGANTNLTASATVTVTCTRQDQWAGETATGFGTRYPNTSNWFMYTAYTTSKVDLVAGRDHQDAGDIFMSRTGSGSSARTTIQIVLHDGWRWDNVAEVLKIQPFDRAPTTYVEPGLFVYKFTVPNLVTDPRTTVAFSGNTVVVTMPGHSPRFYGIHADVQRLVP